MANTTPKKRRLYAAKYSVEVLFDSGNPPDRQFIFDVKVKHQSTNRNYDPSSIMQPLFCEPKIKHLELHIPNVMIEAVIALYIETNAVLGEFQQDGMTWTNEAPADLAADNRNETLKLIDRVKKKSLRKRIPGKPGRIANKDRAESANFQKQLYTSMRSTAPLTKEAVAYDMYPDHAEPGAALDLDLKAHQINWKDAKVWVKTQLM